MPSTLEASLRSTSKPLWLSSTTSSAPSSRAWVTRSCTSFSWMPKDQLGIM